MQSINDSGQITGYYGRIYRRIGTVAVEEAVKVVLAFRGLPWRAILWSVREGNMRTLTVGVSLLALLTHPAWGNDTDWQGAIMQAATANRLLQRVGSSISCRRHR
jgi:hypothetical protein